MAAFGDWLDDRTWYPFGRMIGDTTHPALMLMSAAAQHVLAVVALLSGHVCAGLCFERLCRGLCSVFQVLTADDLACSRGVMCATTGVE